MTVACVFARVTADTSTTAGLGDFWFYLGNLALRNRYEQVPVGGKFVVLSHQVFIYYPD